ncbi:hypothetical protein [Jeotgalibacillus campisalis]|uniref:Lipoprotein n=1 Tax=Jeotgalibacillus campisalis TaxID=220754 RepID=A0A0C2VPW6_9BACL|nr:hypothetical protein [Jeotgalibacillus campisalis]KIL50957.1 hypothetical protein KR50_08380 [Jeotgalibacillus campisalis]
MRFIRNISYAMAFLLLLTACNINDLSESQKQQPGHQKEGSANVLERDREILDNRDDGTAIELDEGGTEAQNDPWDGIGGKETDEVRE